MTPFENKDHRDDEAFVAFVDWARTKPADEPYYYTSPMGCAYAQFLLETGRAVRPCVGPHDWSDLDIPRQTRERILIDERLDGPHFETESSPLGGKPATFGGILARLGL